MHFLHLAHMDKTLTGISGIGAILANTPVINPVIATIAAIVSIACGVLLFIKYGFEIRKTRSENDKLIAEKNKVDIEAREHECPYKDNKVKPCNNPDVVDYFNKLGITQNKK